MCWWAFTGLTHIILEGYFAVTPEFYKEKTPHYLAEVWKEYSKGDSRYVARDAAIVTVEGITAAIEGPASLLAVFAIASKKSYSYILQFAICLGQLYGCLVYFITTHLQGDNFSTSPFYYWAYYTGANSSWVVIPTPPGAPFLGFRFIILVLLSASRAIAASGENIRHAP